MLAEHRLFSPLSNTTHSSSRQVDKSHLDDQVGFEWFEYNGETLTLKTDLQVYMEAISYTVIYSIYCRRCYDHVMLLLLITSSEDIIIMFVTLNLTIIVTEDPGQSTPILWYDGTLWAMGIQHTITYKLEHDWMI